MAACFLDPARRRQGVCRAVEERGHDRRCAIAQPLGRDQDLGGQHVAGDDPAHRRPPACAHARAAPHGRSNDDDHRRELGVKLPHLAPGRLNRTLHGRKSKFWTPLGARIAREGGGNR